MSDELSAGGRVEDQTAIREIDTRGIFLFWKMSFLIKKRRDYRGFFAFFKKSFRTAKLLQRSACYDEFITKEKAEATTASRDV